MMWVRANDNNAKIKTGIEDYYELYGPILSL